MFPIDQPNFPDADVHLLLRKSTYTLRERRLDLLYACSPYLQFYTYLQYKQGVARVPHLEREIQATF